jgi:hypothetical protein
MTTSSSDDVTMPPKKRPREDDTSVSAALRFPSFPLVVVSWQKAGESAGISDGILRNETGLSHPALFF